MKELKKYKECYSCSEMIASNALKCKYCNEEQEKIEYPMLYKCFLGGGELFIAVLLAFIPLILLQIFSPNKSKLMVLSAIESLGDCSMAILVITFLLYAIGQVFNIPFKKEPSKKEMFDLVKLKNKTVRNINRYVFVSVISSIAIVYLGLNRPVKSDHEDYLLRATEFSEHEIIDFYHSSLFSVSTVASEKEDIYYVGVANRVFRVYNEE